jgi:hypothetical protein
VKSKSAEKFMSSWPVVRSSTPCSTRDVTNSACRQHVQCKL